MEQEQKRNTFENKIKERLRLAGSVFGGIVTLIAAVLYIFADKVFDASGSIYRTAIYITIFGYVFVFVAALIIFTIFKNKSSKAELYEEVSSAFSGKCEEINNVIGNANEINNRLEGFLTILSQDIEKEKRIVTEIEIGQYVLNGRAVLELEASVGNYDNHIRKGKIYIQSSLFVLEKGPLEKTILWNLRKGVKYIYIIPAGDVYINSYKEMICDWFRSFSQFLNSIDDYEQVQMALDNEKEYKKFWSKEYQQIYDEAGKLWKNKQISEKSRDEKLKEYRDQCKNIFCSLIETHVDDENEFFITVAAYEVKRNIWEAIIKLPTQNADKEYYAFQIPNENNAEMDSFIRKFRSRYKSWSYNFEDRSTLGGILQLDFSKMFI